MSKRYPGRPKKIHPNPPCKYRGCEKESTVRGFCHTHYVYFRRGVINELGVRLRDPLRVARYTEDSVCILANCPARPCSHGMCNKHALQREVGIIDAAGNRLRALLPSGRKRERGRWVGSTRDRYVLVVAPLGHPHARQDGSILEHRLVMEQALGRYLEEWEIVHHKNGDRADNRWENLELLDGRAKSGTEAHPPGHAFDVLTAVQVLLQKEGVPIPLRLSLLEFRRALTSPQPIAGALPAAVM
jgi:hypothetical protein